MSEKNAGFLGVRGLFWALPFLVTVILLIIGLITREDKPVNTQKNILVLEEEVATNRAEVFSAEVNKKEEVSSSLGSKRNSAVVFHADLNVMRGQLEKQLKKEKGEK